MSTTNILDLNNRVDALEKFAHNVEPIQQQIDELKAWTDPGTKDASGKPIILTDGAAFNAEGLVVTLEPKQSGSGDPSPTNVRPITGLTECVVDVKDEEETTQHTATITFGPTVYGGSVDFKTGKVTVTHVGILFSSLSWNYNASGNNFYAAKPSNMKPVSSEEESPYFIAERYKSDKWANRTNGSICLTTSGNLVVLDSNYTDVQTFVSNVGNDIICYELATPTELTLTPAELELLKGYNCITTNGDNIELTYQPDNLKADILLTVSQLYGSKISIFDGILTGGDTGQVLTKTSNDNYDARWETLPTTRSTTKKSEK